MVWSSGETKRDYIKKGDRVFPLFSEMFERKRRAYERVKGKEDIEEIEDTYVKPGKGNTKKLPCSNI